MATKKSSVASKSKATKPTTKIDKIWDKGKPVRNKNPEAWRKDVYGNTIRRGSHGTEGKFGWQIDHIKPKSKGGSDSVKNLQPLLQKENRKKSDSLPYKKKKK